MTIRSESRAFTLLEILIAMAVSALLLVLLIGTLSAVRDRSLASQCVMRLKNLGNGLALYISDHNGALLPCALPPSAVSWYNLLYPYMGDPDGDIHSPNRPAWQQCPARKLETMTVFTVGYGWNYAYFGFELQIEDWARGFNSKMIEVLQPARTIIIGDSHDKPIRSFNDELQLRLIYTPDAPTEVIAKRHMGKGNYLFLDWHIEALSHADLQLQPELMMKEKR